MHISQEQIRAMVYRSLARILTGEVTSTESMRTLSELQKINP
ncbi:hypothetical protein HMPREF9069_01901 [Atopobium sp. oral taxon 810 str. F0209]|nr:hypothetical protein HMPREF9069_01901 [Atopobium sp. oral taxon 810 str. F0209]